MILVMAKDTVFPDDELDRSRIPIRDQVLEEFRHVAFGLEFGARRGFAAK